MRQYCKRVTLRADRYSTLAIPIPGGKRLKYPRDGPVAHHNIKHYTHATDEKIETYADARAVVSIRKISRALRPLGDSHGRPSHDGPRKGVTGSNRREFYCHFLRSKKFCEFGVTHTDTLASVGGYLRHESI